MCKVAAIVFTLFISISSFAQETKSTLDSVKAVPDSLVTLKNGKVVSIKAYASRYNPRRAILLAAVVPGLGQVYNKKYWKLPLVYGGFIALGYMAINSDQKYNFYRGQLFNLIADPTFKTVLPDAQLRLLVDGYRRQRDFFIILNGFMYLLQLVDAHVDAHLKEFDLNPQLKLSFRPDSQQNPITGRINGFAITLTF